MNLLRRFFGAVLVVGAFVVACERYEAPPQPRVQGLVSGVLVQEPRAPIVIDFGTSIDPGTLSLRIALNETDVEGNLRDEDADPSTELNVLVRRDPVEDDLGATFDIDAAAGRVIVTPDSAMPVGPKLVLLVEPGLASPNGTESRRRVKVPFSYVVRCGAGGATTFQSGVYFVLLEVEKPVGSQIQLVAAIDVDPDTGALVGQFTNADRNPELSCPTPCGAADVCRQSPAPECVPPSTRAGTADEWPDFIPNASPPTGYSFLVQGCAVREGESAGLLTAPATMVVESPRVTTEGLVMTASFTPGPDGIVRATGSLTADVVRLGQNPLGPGNGTMTAVRIPDDRVPPGVPRPPSRAAVEGAGGSDAGP